MRPAGMVHARIPGALLDRAGHGQELHPLQEHGQDSLRVGGRVVHQNDASRLDEALPRRLVLSRHERAKRRTIKPHFGAGGHAGALASALPSM